MKKKWSLFPAFRYVVPSDFEQWLEKMDARGWHLEKTGGWSSFCMVFKKEEPRKFRYIYDLQPQPSKEYVSSHESDGWELTGKTGSVHIWRQEYTEDRPGSFGNTRTLITNNKRNVIASLCFLIFLFLLISAIICVMFFFNGAKLTVCGIIQYIAALALSLIFIIYLVVVIARLIKKHT
ncbi:DUF2812 domain-containing protein [Brucepastera parasyntrophica]|uniref:DUF2812 domain-containing protein n=1 Tax=Brucepastera parasyntrophica TaxID=2880008 RepID=UPI00210AA2D0|nr:DUF2812 domain-containing protein [Brucepastera parasyntrophica]ULQ58776.1 DUF2812 domain-containing protein [Brucepastera parasyntrophica]